MAEQCYQYPQPIILQEKYKLFYLDKLTLNFNIRHEIFKICKFMQILDKDSIQKELNKINIPFDPNIIQEVRLFLNKFIGPLNQTDAQYYIPATCAIMGQTIKIPTVDGTALTSTGIKIENVMRHIGNLSKQKFLDTIQMQLKKSDFSNHSLIEKVNNIKISFRVFKKYKAMFQNLSSKVKIPRGITDDLLSFFWIVFLLLKHKLQALENLNLSTKILVVLIQEIFCNFYRQQSRSAMKSYISQKDNFAELPKINEQEEIFLKSQVYDIVNATIKNRDAFASPTCNNLLSNSVLLSRLVDDLSTSYQKLFQSLPEGRFIDQMTYLELSKNLTPQAVLIKNNRQQISKVINFDDDSDDSDDDQMDDQFHTEDKKPNFIEMGSSSKPISTNLFFGEQFQKAQKNNSDSKLKLSKSMIDFTPVSLGQTKSTWAETFVENYDNIVQPEMKRYFESKNIMFQDFVKEAKQKISFQIEALTKHISNKQKSISESLKMALTFAAELLSKKPGYQIYCQKTLNPLLCVSLYLYNQTTRYLPLELQKYAQIYKADLLDCLRVLYDINQNVNLPLVIKQTLSQLEKQVLIKQIWDTDRGYLLLLEGKTSSTEAIFNRLNRKIYDRIKQICEANRVDLAEVQKIQALVIQILKKKPEIFEKNKLDQIIICSISACLNLNQAKYNLALSTIFSKYNNSVSLSLNSNRQMINNSEEEGAPHTLLQFYNQTFIHQVQDMMNKEENPKYLYTPIRENHLRKLKDQSSSFPPVSGFLGNRDAKSPFGGQSGLVKYQKQILQKMKETDKKQQQCQSPYFGTGSQTKNTPSLKRKITFGDMGSN